MNMVFEPISAAYRRSLITLVFFALISIAHAQSIWDGTTNTDWNTGDGPYTISTAEDLAGLAVLVNSGTNFAGKTINLAANISLNNTTGWEANWAGWASSAPDGLNAWTPIGTSTAANQFQGTFNGNGYVVSGVYIHSTTTYRGLFGYLHPSGTIKNLGIAASYVKGSYYIGVLAGRNSGTISNSYAIGINAMSSSTSNEVGGLVGYNYSGSVNNCYSSGLIIGGGTNYSGGLVGVNTGGGVVSNSYYDKETSGKTDTGKGEGKTTAEMQSEGIADALNFAAGLSAMNGWIYSAGNYPVLSNSIAANPLDGKFANNNAGTELNPYIINTVAHLKNLSSFANQTDFKGIYFKLGQNIAFASLDNPFAAIGSNTKPFNGTFDGDGKTISSVSISSTDSYQGLFGYIGTSGTLKNLGVTSGEVEADGYVGGLAGYLAAGAKIENSYFSGEVYAEDDYAGGLAGFNAGTISGSHFSGTVMGYEYYAGGIAGKNTGTINTSYSSGMVTGFGGSIGGVAGENTGTINASYSTSTGSVSGYEDDIGGLVGNNTSTAKINNSYSNSTVTGSGSDNVGGIAGTNSGAINNSYSTGAVSGSSNIGGFVGRNNGSSAIIYSSYSTGLASGSSNVGGFAGNNASTSKINNSYYDKTVNSIPPDPRNEGKTTADMKAAIFARELNSIAALISMNKWVVNPSANNGYPTISNDLALEDMDFFFAGGDGEELTPYIINTPTHLKNLSFLVDFGKNFQGKFFVLGQDIELDNASNWTPIGTYNGGTSPISKPFNGTFDGASHTVEGVYIDVASSNAQGLFGFLGSNGVIKNLGVIESSVKGGGPNVGGLVGNTVSGAIIENCYFSGTVIGASFTGGLVGFNGGIISNSHSAGTVTGTTFTGGLAGGNQPGTITGSYSTSTVTGTSSVGGLVGRQTNSPAIINNSYSTGAVTGTSSVGGLVGENGRPINNSYSTGAVNGTANDVGGFVGLNTSATISNSYSTGAVTGTANNVGGFVGRNNGTNTQINSSYSIGLATGDSATNIGGFIGDYTSCNSCTINSGYYNKTINSALADPRNEGKTTADMKLQSFADELNIIAGLLGMNEWDITVENSGYPSLSSNIAAANLAPYFAGGDGEELTPYLISTPEQLKNLSWLVDFGINFQGKFLKLANNIALNDTENWENWDVSPPANSWLRIGSNAKYFQGTFDGNNNVVSGIYTSGTADYNGLFGYLGPNGVIKNLGVIDSYISRTGSAWWVGGIVGDNYGTISNSYSTAWVSAPQYAGGLVGRNYGTISNSYSTGKVNGTSNLGGLVGQNNYSSSLGTGRIENSYSTGLVTGTSTLGGLVGNFVTNSVITSSYYDKTVNSTLTDPRSEGKSTADMKLTATFVGWDFANVWNASDAINSGYPYLRDCETEGRVWEGGRCKIPGIFLAHSNLDATYSPTLVLSDLNSDLEAGYAWATPATSLNAGNGQSFPATYTNPDENYATARGNITVDVAKATIAKPTVANTSLVYIGSEQSAGIAANAAYTVTGDKQTNAGNHTATVALNDKANYEWTGSGTADLSLPWAIAKAIPAYTVPTGLTATVGQTLANVTLTSGWAWAVPTTLVGEVGVQTHKANFVPSDIANYNIAENIELSVTVAAPTPIFTNRENPAIGQIGVQTKGNQIELSNLPKNAKVEVYSLQGKRIYFSNSENSQILRIQVQTKGLYVVKAGTQTMRVAVR